MIASLQGTIAAAASDSIVVAVGGVGYKVFVPSNTFANAGDEVFLHTVMIVREDSITLYGFPGAPDRDLFERLITVNGIGPKMAMAMLGALPIQQLHHAVSTNQPDILTRVPGIGRKTAEKIILELKGKLRGADGLIPSGVFDDVNRDVLDALVALGYSIAEAQAALQALPPDAPRSFDERMRRALQYFV